MVNLRWLDTTDASPGVPLPTSSILIAPILAAIPILDAKRMHSGFNTSASVSDPCNSATAASSGLSSFPVRSQGVGVGVGDVSEAPAVGTPGSTEMFGNSPVRRFA